MQELDTIIKFPEQQALEAYKKGYTAGCDNGIEVGRDERNVEIARNMKRNECPVPKIAKLTGLTETEIANIN